MTATPRRDDAGRAAAWQRARRVLAVRLDNLGDVLMTTPALAAIKRSLPGAHLTLLGSPAGCAVAEYVPEIDDAIAFDAPWVKRPGSAEDDTAQLGQAESRLIDRLADAAFDAAVIFTVCTQSALPAALLCRLAGIPMRLAHVRENPYGLLTDWVRDDEVVATGMRHEVERQLALVARVGLRTADDRLRFVVDPAQVQAVGRHLADAGIDPGAPYIVVHPGATAPSRRWPPQRFGQVADAIAQASGHTVLFTGDAGEHALVEAARSAMQQPSLSLAGRLPLGELGALIQGARLLVANNTGPVHIAAAVGTPVVDLYALTNPQHTPWRVPARVLHHDVPCRNCLQSICPQQHHRCLLGVDAAQAASEALALLGDVAGSASGARRPASLRIHAVRSPGATHAPATSAGASI